MAKLPPIKKIDKYDLEFTSYREDIGCYYQHLLESYENMDQDSIMEYGFALISAMFENVGERIDEEEEKLKKPDADYLYDRMIDRKLEEKR